MENIVPWDVPFAQFKYPSVNIITEQFGISAMVVVTNSHSEEYPKYLVHFGKVLAALYYEEAIRLRGQYPDITGGKASGCAYLWPSSPWLQASSNWAKNFLQWPELRHYIIFGGDDIVEILASEVSKIEKIDEKRVIETRHEI